MYRLIPCYCVTVLSISLFNFLIILASSFYYSTNYRVVKIVVTNYNFPTVLEQIRHDSFHRALERVFGRRMFTLENVLILQKYS